jgi:8-oxo-dGTP pyrophosphatase MutT (NUDIX family)
MDIRKTARLILLNPQSEVLLMNIRSKDVSDPSNPIEKPFWVTIGGKIEDGENLFEAATREVVEETGHENVIIGPPIWQGSVVLNWKGVPTELQETFVVAHTDKYEVVRDGLSQEEQEVVQKYKWWSVSELQSTNDIIIPRDLAKLLPDIIVGNYPETVMQIDLSTPDESSSKQIEAVVDRGLIPDAP